MTPAKTPPRVWDGNKSYMPPAVSEVIPLIGSALVLTMVDYSQMSGTFKIFETVEAARIFVHDASKSQFPEWHRDNCKYCKTGFGP